MGVHRGSVRARRLNKIGVAFLLLYDADAQGVSDRQQVCRLMYLQKYVHVSSTARDGPKVIFPLMAITESGTVSE